jgi:formylglycine-generating enzyme required for sulfatase activity
MRYFIAVMAMVCSFAALQAGPANAEQRVALVIGNGAYAKVGKLPNPTRDAEAVSALLRTAGFDAVEVRTDLRAAAMRRALSDFSDRVTGADIAVVFYAGHGIEVDGVNYLIPVDAALERDIHVKDETIPLERVTEIIDGAKRLRLVILDACRDNPFVRTMKRSGRSVGRGLARVDLASSDTLIAFAAKHGSTVADGAAANSPYTAALVKHLATPGLDLRLAFGRVRDEVLKATGNRQEPFLYGSLGGAEITLVAAAPTPVVVAPPQAQPGDAERAWAMAKDSTSIPVLEAFRRQYGAFNVFYDRLAEARIEELRRLQLAKAEEDRKRADADLWRPGRVFRDCPDCPEMVVVPAGSFTMGSPEIEDGRDTWLKQWESPQHLATIPKPFAVGKFEVTFGEWDACVAAGGCKNRPGDEGWGRGRRPVFNVSWNDVTNEFLPWLSGRSGKGYRLLSEAEWEYAARAGTTTRYSFGDSISTSQARYSADRTVEVGSFPSNRFGLHDMHGNVLEWVQDCFHDEPTNPASYRGAPTDGSAWTAGPCSSRGTRGGSFQAGAIRVRSAMRNGHSPSSRTREVGFRVARSFIPRLEQAP